MLLCFGCGQHSTNEGHFKITLAKEDPPEFKRTYEAPLPDGRKVIVTIRTWHILSTKRTASYGELIQSDGKYVLYDIEHVADKIIDRDLVPIVERLSKEILELDAQFFANQPTEYTDVDGHIWRRVK